jgi:DNA-binding NarL/FixJ family response regulator
VQVRLLLKPPRFPPPLSSLPRFDPLDPGFRARGEAINGLLKPWTLICASGSHLEAQLMTRASLTAQLNRMIGSCVTPEEVMQLVESRKERCLLVLVNSIAPDHGEVLVNQLRALPHPPAVLLLLESTDWLQVNAYPLDRVDAVVKTQSFGSGVLIEALTAVNKGHRYVDPALLCALKANTRGNQPQLTPRERETLEELAQGLTNREIAQRLGIAETTTREYTRSLLQKLNARNRTMAVSAAMKLGLLLRNSIQDGVDR